MIININTQNIQALSFVFLNPELNDAIFWLLNSELNKQNIAQFLRTITDVTYIPRNIRLNCFYEYLVIYELVGLYL